ncbi:MAG: response regulator transcription factor [Desulfobacteraceae bacterium]
MALIVFTRDTALNTRCKSLFEKQHTVRHLAAIPELAILQTDPDDVLIIDLEGCREKDIPKVTCPTLVLVTIPDNDQAMRLLQNGIRAYGNRHMHEKNLQQAVAALQAGQIWLPPSIINQMITSLPRPNKTPAEHPLLKNLTAREQEVAGWLANGLSNREIGEKLFVSIRTVKAHLTSIFQKTGCRDRLELATRLKQ